MKIFIPSKNRASQLDLLLRSLKVNLVDSDNLDIHVLYRATDEKFWHGYEKLARTSPLPVKLIQEENFCEQFKQELDNSEYICLFTDDCIFYRPYSLSIDNALDLITEDVWCFSWRLGLNTTTQYYYTRSQQEPLNKLGYDYIGLGHIKWNWKIRPSHQNFGYGASWDGHIYRGSDLFALCRDINFTNPRAFESKMVDPILRSTIIRKNMVAPVENCVVVNTVNVTQIPSIPAGLIHPCSLEEMNDRYLSGQVIDLNGFDFSNITGCHDELKVRWINE